MTKKLLSFLLTITMAVSFFVPTIVTADSSSDEIVVFEDDFERGNMFIRIAPDWVYGDGELRSPSSVGCNSFLENKAEINYRDYSVEATFCLNEWNFDANTTWTGIIMRETICIYLKPVSKDSNVCMVRYWDMNTGKDDELSKYTIEPGVDYNIKIIARDKFIQVQLKKASEEFYTDCGTYTDITMKNGHYYWRSMISSVSVKDVKVAIPKSSDLCFTKYGLVEIGTNDIQFKNEKNVPVKFSVNDTSKAEITSDGKLNVKARGVFMVTAKDENDKVLANAVYSGGNYVNSISFAYAGREIYVGDSMDVEAVYDPYNADFKKTIWTSSDPSVVEIVGRGERIGVRALKAGTAVISAELAFGGSVQKKAETTITVVPKPEQEKDTATLAASGTKHEIPQYFFGLATGDRAYAKTEFFNYPEAVDVFKDIGFTITRVPGGGSSCYFDWKTGRASNITYAEDWKGYSTEEIYKLANDVGIPAVYALNTRPDMNSPQDIVDLITEIKATTDQPVFVELINEAYAASSIWPDEWQTVDGFVESMDVYYKAIKEAHPDVLVGATALSKTMEKRILADPDTDAFKNPDDWEYTTPGRVRLWNEKVAAGGSYDTVTSHPYSHQVLTTFKTQDEYMRDHFAFSQDMYMNLLLTSREYGGKKLWITEWGDIEEERMGEADRAVQGRMQCDWDVGVAISEGARLLNMLKSNVVDISHYWDLTGSGGFGMSPFWAGNVNNSYMTPQSRYYMFKELGKLLNNNTYYHDIIGVDVDYETVLWPWCNRKTDYYVNLEDVVAHGIGTEDKINNVVFINNSDKEMTVSIDGLKLKKTVSLGDREGNFKDYMVKERAHTTGYTADEVVKPTYFENEAFSDTIILPAFSLVIADADGNATIKTDTVAGKISKLNEYELKHTVVLKPGKNTAYVNNVKTVVDEDTNVKPIIKDGRTLLPLRFVSESVGANVEYNDATRDIKVTLGDIVAEFQVGSKDYKVNGESFTLDVPAEVQYGRTLIPLRAMVEALGKTVYWDDRGLIVVSNIATSFHEPYRELDPEVFTEILALFDGQN